MALYHKQYVLSDRLRTYESAFRSTRVHTARLNVYQRGELYAELCRKTYHMSLFDRKQIGICEQKKIFKRTTLTQHTRRLEIVHAWSEDITKVQRGAEVVTTWPCLCCMQVAVILA